MLLCSHARSHVCGHVQFIGWLEVIRQELVFVTGDDDAAMLASLIEGIKFQLTGETPMQGTAPRGKEDDPEFEVHSKIFQLYAGVRI